MVRAPLHFHGRIPVPEVAPLTYRDGVSQLELVYELSEYLKSILHPSLQSTIDQVVADAERLLSDASAQYVDGVQEFQRIHDAFMSDVNAHLVALNDGAVTDLVEDDGSLLGKTLRQIFTDKKDFTELSEKLEFRMESFSDNFTEFTDNMNDAQSSFEESVHDALEEQVSQTNEGIRASFNLTDQIDYVDMVSGMSSMNFVQVRKTGTGDRGTFQVSRVGPGRPGYHMTWVMSPVDDLFRVSSVRVGYVGSGTPNDEGWYDDTDKQFDLVGKTVHEFALKFRPANREDLDTVWAPQHSGIPTCVEASKPTLSGPTERLLIDTEPFNTRWGLDNNPVVLRQHVYARHPETGNRNLLEIRLAHKFNPDGTTELTGMWKALEDVYISTGYTGMYAGFPEYVNSIVTSLGNSYPVGSEQYGTGIYRMEPESDVASSYAMKHSGARNFISAIRYDQSTQTLRRGQFGKPSNPAMIDYRSSDLVKVYNSQFDNTVIPAGYMHRFKVTYAHVYGAGINQIVAG